MALCTKCILHAPGPDDGLRISVMSRHTLNDGVTPDPRITPASYELHFPQLGPSPKLIGAYYKRGLPWEEFETLFLEEIRTSSRLPLIKALADYASQRNVTLLCIEETADRCHRRLVAEACLTLRPDITIEHR